MRLARRLTVLLFVVTAICFGLYVTRDEMLTDKVAPVISCDSDTFEASVEAGDEELLAGMTAQDDRDGDVTASLVVVSRSKFIETGRLRVNYAAFDAQGNAATYTRTLTYSDYTSPRFALSEPLRFNASTWSYSLLNALQAEDCLDGDISNLIKYRFDDENWYYGEDGRLGVTFQVTNSAGDTVQLPLTVEVLDEEDYDLEYPELTEYLVYTSVGDELTPRSYLTAEAREAGTVRVDDSAVDYDVPGVYEIVYTLVGEGSVTLFVVVEE